MLHERKIDLVVNIPKNLTKEELDNNIPKNLTKEELDNGYRIRRAAVDFNIPIITNTRLASAFITAFCNMPLDNIQIKSWDEYR